MMKKKICWVATIIVILILVVSCLMYVLLGYFPVVGKCLADSKLSNYCGETIKAKYDFLDNVYTAYSTGGNLLQYDLSTNTIFDEAHNDMIASQVSEKYLSFVAESSAITIEYPDTVSVWTEIDSANTSKTYSKIYVMTIYEDTNITETESKTRICELAQTLVEYIDMNVTSIQMTYANKSGLYELRCDFGKDTVMFDRFAEYVEKFDEKDLPLDYIEWQAAD